MREIDEYSFTLIPQERIEFRDLAIVSFLLLAGWIVWAILKGLVLVSMPWFWVVTAALLVLLYSACVRLRFLFPWGPVLRLSPDGIEDYQHGFGLIPWEEILKIQPRLPIHPLRPGPFLDVQVREPKKFIRRVSFYLWLELPIQTLRKGVLVIPFEKLDGDMEDALDWIRSYHPDVSIIEPVEGED
jgi:hypothetical protein